MMRETFNQAINYKL